MSVTLRRGIVSELIGSLPIPRDAFHTKAFSDLRIVTSDGGCVDAHRLVVAAASPIMRRSLAASAAAVRSRAAASAFRLWRMQAFSDRESGKAAALTRRRHCGRQQRYRN